MMKMVVRLAYYYQLLNAVKEHDWFRVVDWVIIIGVAERKGILVEQKVRA